MRVIQKALLAVGIASLVSSASAFSLLGPFAAWQSADLSYDAGGGQEIGGPMNIGEEYRWNIKTITYGFDKSFLDYFGQRGVDDVNQAIAILNAIPPVSKMSVNLSEFPTDSRRINFQAGALGVYSLKSWALGMLVEEMGLADPERFVWTLRSRTVPTPTTTNYFVVMRNFDPVSWVPTPYVNETLYTYSIVDFGVQLPAYSDARESQVDPLAFSFNSVAGIMANRNVALSSYLNAGVFFTGLTRDDIGGLRYLLTKNNINVEGMVAGTTGGGGGAAWTVGGGGSNSFVNVALRRGVDKVVFKQLNYYGIFLPVTNNFNDSYINVTNRHAAKQRVQRVLNLPDIIFATGDLGLNMPSGSPVLVQRTSTTAWANNSATNSQVTGSVTLQGPGVIQPGIVIAFSNVGPYIWNQNPNDLDEAHKFTFWGGWASFDGTTNAPFVYPNGASIQELENTVLSGGF